MTAHSKAAKRRIRVVRSGTKPVEPPSSNRPTRPRVDRGPVSYGRTKKGFYIVVRFFVSQNVNWRRPDGRWWVLDIEEEENRGIAKGTKKEGYRSKEEAVQVAREYRDEYGAYGKAPF